MSSKIGMDKETFHVTSTAGNVEVMMETSNARNGLSRFTLDGDTIRDKLDEFLKGVIEGRCNDLNLDARVKQILDRRIEVAVNAATINMQATVSKMASEYAMTRVKAEIDAMPIAVSLSVSTEPGTKGGA